MKGSHRQRQRRAFALVTCLLWLLGVEVLPDLHLAAHHGDHTHAADGTIVAAVHAHGDDHHAHGHDDDAEGHLDRARASGADEDGSPSIDRPRREPHRAGGVSHHAVALHQPPAPPRAPAWVARASWRLEASRDAAPRPAALARPTSRGPPSI